jgi:hypothetical protein
MSKKLGPDGERGTMQSLINAELASSVGCTTASENSRSAVLCRVLNKLIKLRKLQN